MRRPWLWVVVVANLVAVLALVFVDPSAMLSPGALAPAHVELAGDCFTCHAPLRGAASDRCVRCHAAADLGVRTTRGASIARPRGRTVGASLHQELSAQRCTTCHSEHGRLTPRRFSHALLRAEVRGACANCHVAPTNELHRDLRVRCGECHSSERWSPATFDHATIPGERLARCERCHAAPSDRFHRQITAACAQCHSPQRWRPSTFNHDRHFVLDRDHNTTCATCHSGDDFTRYACFGCHEHTPANVRAKHEGEGIRNSDNCVSCHRGADGEGGEPRRGRERDER